MQHSNAEMKKFTAWWARLAVGRKSEEDLPLEDYQGSAEKYRKHFGFNAVRK